MVSKTPLSMQALGRVVAKTAAYTVAAGDEGVTFDATGMAAPFALTLPAASSVGDDFQFFVTNRSFKESTIRYVTLARNGTDTIDGEAANLNIYAEAVRVIRNPAGTGWLVAKVGEVLCWDYSLTAAAVVAEFTAPFNDTQFEEYRLEIAALNALASEQFAIIRLGIAGTLQTTAVYSRSYSEIGSTPTSTGGNGASNFEFARVPASAWATGHVFIKAARKTGGASNGPVVITQGNAGAVTVSTCGHVTTAGALSSVAVIGNSGNLAVGTRFRIFGVRKGA